MAVTVKLNAAPGTPEACGAEVMTGSARMFISSIVWMSPDELYLEDGETTDGVAEECAAKLVQEDQVDVIFGGIFSSTRQAIKAAAVDEGKTLYIYPEQY